MGIMIESHSVRLRGISSRRPFAPYSQCVEAGDAGIQTPAAAVAGDQLPGAEPVAVHVPAATTAASQSPAAARVERQTGRFHNSSSMGDLILP